MIFTFEHLFARATNRSIASPSSRPILFKRKSKFVLFATSSLLFMTAANVATVGRRRHKKVPQPCSFIVFFVPPLNNTRVKAHNTIFVLQINKTAV